MSVTQKWSKQPNEINENNELENASSFPLFREFSAPNEFYFVVERTSANFEFYEISKQHSSLRQAMKVLCYTTIRLEILRTRFA